jgi:hypothetical protein
MSKKDSTTDQERYSDTKHPARPGQNSLDKWCIEKLTTTSVDKLGKKKPRKNPKIDFRPKPS